MPATTSPRAAFVWITLLLLPRAAAADAMIWHTPQTAYVSASLNRADATPPTALRLVPSFGTTIAPVYIPLVLPDGEAIDSVRVCYERAQFAATAINATSLVLLNEPTSETTVFTDTTVRDTWPANCYQVDVPDITPSGAMFLKLDLYVINGYSLEIGAIGIKTKSMATAAPAGADAAPRGFDLFQSHPNPASSATTIGFETERGGRARLAIFDVAGRRVRALLDEVIAPGRREVVWDGADGEGRPVARGVYFYQLEVDGEAQGRQMVRLR